MLKNTSAKEIEELVLAKAKMVIMLQYISVSNEHIIHHKRTQCYVSIISQF